MDNVKRNLAVGIDFAAACIVKCCLGTDKDVAKNPMDLAFALLHRKGNAVGRGGIAKIALMELRHFFCCYKVNGDFIAAFPFLLDHLVDDSANEFNRNGNTCLRVFDVDFQAVLCRNRRLRKARDALVCFRIPAAQFF